MEIIYKAYVMYREIILWDRHISYRSDIAVMIFAEPHADGALAFGIKDQLTTLTRDHI